MSQIGNGSTPGGNGDAKDKAGKQANANPDKSAELDEHEDLESGNDGKPAAGDKDKPQGKFYTQDEIDKLISKRLSRATKDAEDKAQLSKEQLLERERDDAVTRLRKADARDAFITKSGIDYGKASRLFRMYESELEFDDDGKPENISDVLKTAKAEWPELFKKGKDSQGDADLGGGQGDGKPAVSMNDAIRSLARRK